MTGLTTAPLNTTFEERLFAELLLWKKRAEVADERARRVQDNFAKYRNKHQIKALAKRLIAEGKAR